MMVFDCNRIMVSVALTFVLVAGCVAPKVYSLPSTMEQLKAGGYTGSHTNSTTVTGEQRENPKYEIWWKEYPQKGRIRHYCFVPGPSLVGAGYKQLEKGSSFPGDRGS
jgi:hypothetical protein